MKTPLSILALALLTLPSAVASNSRILFVGDSHVTGVFGSTLDSLLTQIPKAQIATYGSCGSIAATWMNHGRTTCGSYEHVHSSGGPETRAKTTPKAPTPQLAALIKGFKPTHLIVELGTNYGPKIMDDEGRTERTEADLKKFVQIIKESGVKCLWVSLPDSASPAVQPYEITIREKTREAVEGVCQFFDSTQITHYPPHHSDGLHYRMENGLGEMAKNWATAAYREFMFQFGPKIAKYAYFYSIKLI